MSGKELSTYRDKIRAANKEIFAAKAALKKNPKLLEEGFAKVFEDHPTLAALRWEQYTPGFIDGDPCRFTRGMVQVSADGDTFFGEGDDWPKDSGAASLGDALDEAEDFLNELGYDILEHVFGDPVVVTVTPKGIKVEEEGPPY